MVFDYSEPLENYPPERRDGSQRWGLQPNSANPGSVISIRRDRAEFRDYGFGDLEDLGMSEMAVRYLGAPADGPDSGPGPHMIRAARTS